MSLIISDIALFLSPLILYTFEPASSLAFIALLLVAGVVFLASRKNDHKIPVSSAIVLAVAGLAVISLLFHWIVIDRFQPMYLDNMLRGTLYWLAASAIFLLSSDKSRTGIYTRIAAICAGAAGAAGYGLNNYLQHLKVGEGKWREFGNFTDPDFFAGQLVMAFPIALVLYLGAKNEKGKTVWLLYLLATLLQFAAILTTASRFAPISLVVGIGVIAAALVFAVRQGMSLPKITRLRIAALAAVLVVGGAVVAKPLTSRLSSSTIKTQAHSGAFRLWTWKGTVKLIESDPIFGAGPGQFVYAYPKRAITGYTTHAHSAYLQTAADIGVPALLLLFAGFAMIVLLSLKTLRNSPVVEQGKIAPPKRKDRSNISDPPQTESFLSEVALIDDRYLVIGLLGAMATAMSQNLIDSDWFNFESGITLFAVAGTLTALAPKPTTTIAFATIKKAALAIYGVGAVAASILGIAALQELNGAYVSAVALDPLNGKYFGNAALNVYIPTGDTEQTEESLKLACKLTPDAPSFHRLGSFFDGENNPAQAIVAFKSGLEYDPHSIQILMSAAEDEQRVGDTSRALGYYLRIAALEISPYGTVRAIPEVSETRFAFADAAIGANLLTRKMPAQAISYFNRVVSDCELYSDQGGASSPMRVAMNQGAVDNALDSNMRSLYVSAMNNLVLAYADEGNLGEMGNIKSDINAKLERFDSGLKKISN